jgi:hypothetical protein
MSNSRRVLSLGISVLAAGSMMVSPAMGQSRTPAPAPVAAPADAGARHVVSGEVTKVDAKNGWIDVKTPDGRMKLHFPPSALQNVKVGDSVSIEVALASAPGTSRQ